MNKVFGKIRCEMLQSEAIKDSKPFYSYKILFTFSKFKGNVGLEASSPKHLALRARAPDR